MKALAQIRAATALRWSGQEFRGQQGGEVVKKFPMLVKSDGLLAALAFAIEKAGDHLELVRSIAEHLAADGIEICESTTPRDLVEELANSHPSRLRRATAETLAFLNYLKRFVA